VLVVDAARMQHDGHEFHVTGNGVWLVDAVPPDYLTELG
jgi:putative RNA 2'-phosphotransferase